MLGRLSLEAVFIDSEGGNLRIQSLPGNPELGCGSESAGDAASRLPKCGFNHLSFPVDQTSGQGLCGA